MNRFKWRSLKTRVTFFTLAIFLIGLWSLAFYASKMLREDMQRLLGEQQFSTATILAAEVNQDLDDRLRALEMIAALVPPATLDSTPAMQDLLDNRPLLASLFNGGVFTTRLDGIATASLPLSVKRAGIDYRDRDYIQAALTQGRSTVSKPTVGKALNGAILGMATPIRDAQGQVIGALAGVIDLSKPNFLDKITAGRYGQSGSYLIAAPQHNLFITASDKSRIMRPLPASGTNALHDKYVGGYEGYGVLVNFRGEEELTAAKRIPVAGWFMGVALPTAEAFAPIRTMQRHMLIATIFLTLLAGFLTWWILQWQLSPLLVAARTLANLSATNQVPQALAVTSQDEIGDLIDGFNRLLGTLNQRDLALRESEERFRLGFENANVGVCLVSLDGEISKVNRQMVKIFGYAKDEMEGMHVNDIAHPDHLMVSPKFIQAAEEGSADHAEFEKKYIHKQGHLIFGQVASSLIRNTAGEPICFISHIVDITKRKQAEEKIEELAYSDALTHLPNRTLLHDRLKHAMMVSHRSGMLGALLFIDLDHFKTLNDTLGHDKGDLLLQQVAQRLKACVREGDTVARIGGDEFVVVLENLSANPKDVASQTRLVAEKILSVLSQIYQLGDMEHRSTASIGATLFSGHDTSIDDLLKQADLAMYKAKDKGRNALSFFDPAMQVAVMARAALESGLRKAIQENQFMLHYQAQVIHDGRVTGAEVLVRWLHPERGMVSPAEFIPVAEETGLILPLGHWVLYTACTQLARWAHQPDLAHLTIAVNVSAKQFREPDFVASVVQVLQQTGVDPTRLKLELTESLLVDNVQDIIEKMFALKAKGVGFSLDDFGTGYSSLAYLKLLPLDQLKIDQSFVRDVLVDPNDASIAKTIVALAQSLGLGVIAEGVETQTQRDFLSQAGCHAYQGYFFSRPLPVADFETFARQV